MQCYFQCYMFCTVTLCTSRSRCAAPSVVVFCSSISCLPAMLSRYFLNDCETVPVVPIMTGVAYFIHSTYPPFLLQGFYISKSSQLLSWSHFYLMKCEHLLTCMFLFHHYRLWGPVYSQGRLCQFALVEFTIWLPNFHYLFRLFLAHVPAAKHRQGNILIATLFTNKHTSFCDCLWSFNASTI